MDLFVFNIEKINIENALKLIKSKVLSNNFNELNREYLLLTNFNVYTFLKPHIKEEIGLVYKSLSSVENSFKNLEKWVIEKNSHIKLKCRRRYLKLPDHRIVFGKHPRINEKYENIRRYDFYEVDKMINNFNEVISASEGVESLRLSYRPLEHKYDLLIADIKEIHIKLKLQISGPIGLPIRGYLFQIITELERVKNEIKSFESEIWERISEFNQLKQEILFDIDNLSSNLTSNFSFIIHTFNDFPYQNSKKNSIRGLGVVKKFLIDGELEAAINYIISMNDNPEFVQLKSRFESLKNDRHLNLIRTEDYNIEFSKIAWAIINILEK